MIMGVLFILSKKHLIFLLLVCIAGILLISSASAGDLNETMVSQIDDDTIGIEDAQSEIDANGIEVDEGPEVLGANHTPQTFSEIQITVDSAGDEDTIILDGYYLFESTVTVNKSLTFVGKNDATVDGNNAVRLFEVTANNVTFKNITFKNGKTDGDGGAIYYHDHSYVGSVVGCSFVGNSARWGGAIYYHDYSYVGSVVGCSFVNNSASYGGAITLTHSSVIFGSVVNCTFEGNSAIEGGAISGSVSVVGCSFVGNSARGYSSSSGGAINTIYLSAVNCNFADNSANSWGGAIYVRSGFGSVVNCTFEANSANNAGGAVYVGSDSGSAVNCSFVNNSASGEGGACYQVSVEHCLFEYNHAANGGAVSGKNATYSTFNHNTATGYGGAVYKAYVSTNSKFNNNSANIGDNTYNVTFIKVGKSFSELNKTINENNNSDVYLYCDYIFLDSDSEFKEGIIVNRNVTIHGNGYNIDGQGIARIFNVSNNNVIFQDIVFLNGNASANGGAIYGDCTVIDCSFVNNSATGEYGSSGGAVYFNGGSIVNCIFINNFANLWGGSIYGGNVTGCTFINNSAGSSGSAGAMYGGSAINCTFINNTAGLIGALSNGVAINCTFTNNYADLGGGAIGYSSATNCIFINNHIRGDFGYTGGAMDGGSAFNCTFINNSAGNSYGGAISRASAVDCIFINNSAGGNGGAIYVTDAINITNCSFKENHANIGGAIYTYQGVNVINCNFTGNTATNDAGAIYNGNATGCVFINNSAESGGAIYNGSAVNCSFADNSADMDGGAICKGSAVNCSFIGNSADNCGAVDRVFCVNCSFINNSATFNGGALYGGSAVNCIFDNNFANMVGGAIYFNKDGYAVNCTFINNSAKDYGNAVCGGSCVNCTFEGHGSDVLYDTSDVLDCLFDIYPTVKYHYTSFLEVNDLICNIGDNSFLIVNLSDIRGPLSNKLIRIINDEYSFTTTQEGTVTLNIKDYLTNVGKYIINVNFNGDEINDPVRKNATVIIKSDSILTVNNLTVEYGDEGFLITDLSDARGLLTNRTLNFIINGKKYNISTDSNGSVKLNIRDYIKDYGEFSASVAFAGEELSNPSSNSSRIILKYGPILDVDDLSLVKGEESSLAVGLSNIDGPLFGKSITFKFNGETRMVPTISNVAYLKITDYLKELGNHTVEVSFEGDELNSRASKNVTVYIYDYKGNLTFAQIGKYYNDTVLMFKLTDLKTGENIADASVHLTFSNGENVTLKTGSDGWANYSVPFAPGSYDFEAKIIDSNVDVNVIASDVEINNIIGTIEISQNGTGYNNSDLVVRLYNPDNGDVYRKINVNLQFDTGDSEYIMTDDDGIAVYHIPFTPNTYGVVAQVTEDYTEFNRPEFLIVIEKSYAEVILTPDEIIFAYGDTGYANLTVSGGIIENISVVGYHDIKLGFDGRTVSVTGLGVGHYLLNVTVTGDTYYDSVSKTFNITVIKTASGISGDDIVFDYEETGSTTFAVTGGTVGNASVIDYRANVTIVGNTVTVSGLDAGNYTLQVITAPDNDHSSVTGHVKITVNRIDSSVGGDDIVFDYNGSGSANINVTGGKVGSVSVVGHPEIEPALVGNTVTVSGLDAGTYYLRVTTSPDVNHKAVCDENIRIIVNKINSSLSGEDIVFDYEGSGSTDLTVIGSNVSSASVVDYDANITINGNVVTVSGLKVGNYTLRVITASTLNYNSITDESIKITVNKANSTVSGRDIVFDYKGSRSVNLTVHGGTVGNATVAGHDEADVALDGNTVTVSGLVPGNYKLEVITDPDESHLSVTGFVNIIVNEAPSMVTGENIVFDWNTSGNTSLTVIGGTVRSVGVVSHPEVKPVLSGNVVTVFGLNAGTYYLQVTTEPDLYYKSVTDWNIKIIVNKVDASISGNDIVFSYGSTGSTTLTVVGGTVGNATVINHDEANVDLDGNTIYVSGLDEGIHYMRVTVVPDSNHNPVSRTIMIGWAPRSMCMPKTKPITLSVFPQAAPRQTGKPQSMSIIPPRLYPTKPTRGLCPLKAIYGKRGALRN